MKALSRSLRLEVFGAVALLGVLLAGVATPMRCDAQAVQPREALEDAKLYFTAPLRWDTHDWLEFGGTLVAFGVAHEFDDNVRTHFVGTSANGLNGEDPNSAQDALAGAVLLTGTWLLAGVIDEPAGWRELGSMLEASTFATISSEVLKLSLGRQRPNETTDPDQWFKGGGSFPSLHTSVAFAIGGVFAESGDERYRWLRRTLGYGMAGATAYVRLDHNAHWASDVVAGAALGLSTARFTMNRRTDTVERTSVTVMPAQGGGVMLGFSMPLR
jgi:membrane-associated phospholipid phosphatase